MKTLDESTLKDMLAKDYVGRNNQLSTLISFINSLEESTTLAIDGSWGSGKTIFVKQIELLNQNEELPIPQTINHFAIDKFRNDYSVYYFNAWENDFLEDPLQALVYSLINELSVDSLNERAAKKASNAIDLNALVKNLSKGGIDISKLTSEQEMIKEVKTVIDRNKYIHELLDKYTTKTEKKLLFIIDELDRCKPSFAVNLLEAIKHYFVDEDIIFLIATDNTQLSHTIRKYYGSEFDGATYLNKFFDFNIGLQQPDKEKYLNEYLKKERRGYYSQDIPMAIAEHLGMSLREIETYLKAVDLVVRYIDRERQFRKKSLVEICQWVFTPYALALKIHRPVDYTRLVKGDYSDGLLDLYRKSAEVSEFITGQLNHEAEQQEQDVSELLVKSYESLFLPNQDSEIKNIRREFVGATNLINNFTTIKKAQSQEGADV